MVLQEKFIQSLEYATKSLQTADHMAYITFPLVKEKRLLLKILSEIHSSILNTINAILQYEFYWKRINLYSDAKSNFDIFRHKCAPRYKISPEQINKVIEIFSLIERHKKSPFEFVKDDKIVIMSEGMRTDTITLEKIKSYLLETKDILKKANTVIKGS